MNAKQKYLKDESGQVISPVVSTETVYDASGNTLGGGIIPIGGILPYVGKTAPLNYLLCDGSDFTQSDYPELYNLLGHSWTPDLRGLVIVGWDTTKGALSDIGFDCSTIMTTGGEAKHTLTINEMPGHKHSLTSWKNPKEYTPQPTTGFGFTRNEYAFSNVATDGDGTVYTANDSVAIGSTGGNQAHNNLQPYIVLNYIIRAK